MSKESNVIISIDQYINARNEGATREEIQKITNIDEATSYTWELSFQCFKNKISLDKAIDFVLKREAIITALEQSMDALAHVSNQLLNPFNGNNPKIVDAKVYEDVSIAYNSVKNILFPEN